MTNRLPPDELYKFVKEHGAAIRLNGNYYTKEISTADEYRDELSFADEDGLVYTFSEEELYKGSLEVYSLQMSYKHLASIYDDFEEPEEQDLYNESGADYNLEDLEDLGDFDGDPTLVF